MSDSKRTAKPIPAVAAGRGPFVISDLPIEAGGRTANPWKGRCGIFAAPLALQIEALAVRQHEYGHLGLETQRLGPARLLHYLTRRRIHPNWSQAALDVYVNSYMSARGAREIRHLPLPSDPESLEDLERFEAATLYLRSESLDLGSSLRRNLSGMFALNHREVLVLDRTVSELSASGESGEALNKEQVLARLSDLQKMFGPSEGTAGLIRSSLAALNRICEMSIPGGLRILRRGSRGGNGDLAVCCTRGRGYYYPSERPGRWGKLEVLRPTLQVPIRTTFRRRSPPAFTGAFRHPERALLPVADGRAFGIKAPRGGSILIDCSGSMRLDSHDVEGLLTLRPGMSVACYAADRATEEAGRLVVLAERGRMVEAVNVEKLFGKGNVVDGPSLRWLARRPEPRIWISDGVVTGTADRRGRNLDLEVEQICSQFRVTRFATIESFVQSARNGMRSRRRRRPINNDKAICCRTTPS